MVERLREQNQKGGSKMRQKVQTALGFLFLGVVLFSVPWAMTKQGHESDSSPNLKITRPHVVGKELLGAQLSDVELKELSRQLELLKRTPLTILGRNKHSKAITVGMPFWNAIQFTYASYCHSGQWKTNKIISAKLDENKVGPVKLIMKYPIPTDVGAIILKPLPPKRGRV